MLRTQYDKLFGLIGTKFGAADEAHFNLPNLHHRFIEGTTTLSEVGRYVEAGLPNSKGGSPYIHTTNVTTGSGAIGWDIQNGDNILQIYTQQGKKACANIRLNLQTGNALFGASDTVQPKAIRSYFLIRYAA